jgi:hypothetical protein
MPEFGAVRLSELQRKDLQGYVDRLLVDGVHNPSTIRNTLVPLRVIFRRAVVRGEVAVTPTIGLEIPAARGRRERIASPAEAEQFRSPAPASGPSRWRRCSAPTWSNSAWCPVDRRPCRRPRARLPVPAQDPERPRAGDWKKAGMKPIGLHECRHTSSTAFSTAREVPPGRRFRALR